MKKTATFLCALALVMGSMSAQEERLITTDITPFSLQTPSNSFGAGKYQWKPLRTTNVELKDVLHNRTYNMDAILKEGKSVLIDFSAVWCDPCWTLHQSGNLDKILRELGPEGKNKLELFWVDIEGSSMEVWKGKKPSLGDWTHNETWIVPMVSDADLSGKIGVPVKFVPTLVLIGPDGKYIDVAGPVRSGNITALEDIMSDNITPNDKPQVVVKPSRSVLTKESIVLSVKVVSIPEVTYQWTIAGATPNSSTEATPTCVWATPGEYEVKLVVTNKNGSTEEKFIVKAEDKILVKTFPYKEGFNDVDLSPQWKTIDANGDGSTWETTINAVAPFGVSADFAQSISPDKSRNNMLNWSFLPSSIDGGGIQGKSVFPKDYLISPQIEIPNDEDAKPGCVIYALELSQENNTIGTTSMYVSTTGLKLDDFTEQVLSPSVLIGSNGWKSYAVDLSKFKGQKIYVAIVHEDKGDKGLARVLDNFTVTMDGTISTKPIASVAAIVTNYDAAAAVLTVEAEGLRSVRLFDTNGRVVAFAEGTDCLELSLGDLAPDVYVVQINTKDGVEVRKLMIQ